jgi:acetyl esterase/lipase
VIALFIVLTSAVPVRVALKSAGFFTEIFPDMPVYPLRWVTPEPELTLISFSHEDGWESAYVYQPAQSGCHGGLVLYIGMGPEHRDPHLDRAARAFARNGIAVLVPVSRPMVDYLVVADEHDYAVSAFQYLQNQRDIHPDRVGMFGVSVGGSVVAKAAQDPAIRDDVAMLHSLGGYYDAFDLLAGMVLGGYELDGEWHEWEPSSTTVRVIRDSILQAIPRDDYVALWHLITDKGTEIPEGLTPEGEALARVIANRDRDRMPELIVDLPQELVALLEAISPAYGVEHQQAPTLLLHDVNDHVIPYSESVRFYDELENARSKRLTLLNVFHHVRPDEEGDRRSLVGDGIRLYRHVYEMNRHLDGRGWVAHPFDLLPFINERDTCD